VLFNVNSTMAVTAMLIDLLDGRLRDVGALIKFCWKNKKPRVGFQTLMLIGFLWPIMLVSKVIAEPFIVIAVVKTSLRRRARRKNAEKLREHENDLYPLW
tara:strand:- start:249 stop:548 length:300 start_codon:yes stop_codon:yes gene_type:complete